MTEMELKMYHKIITASWQIMKEYLPRSPLSDSEWTDLIADLTEMKNGCGEHPFAKTMAVAVADEMQRLHKREVKG